MDPAVQEALARRNPCVFFDMTIAEENADLKSQIEALTAAQEEGQGALATVGETNEKLEKANAALVDKVAQLENELADVKSVLAEKEKEKRCGTT